MPVIPEPGRQKQEAQKFKASLCNVVSSQGQPELGEETVSKTVAKQKNIVFKETQQYIINFDYLGWS